MNDSLSKASDRIKDISLKWKLLIPFLFFAFAGTTVLTTIGLTSQQKLIKEEEKKGLMFYYQQFLEEIDEKKSQAMSLAEVIAENPEVQRLLAERNRPGLNDFLLQTYAKLRTDFSISQFHFHVPLATFFFEAALPQAFRGRDAGLQANDYRCPEKVDACGWTGVGQNRLRNSGGGACFL